MAATTLHFKLYKVYEVNVLEYRAKITKCTTAQLLTDCTVCGGLQQQTLQLGIPSRREGWWSNRCPETIKLWYMVPNKDKLSTQPVVQRLPSWHVLVRSIEWNWNPAKSHIANTGPYSSTLNNISQALRAEETWDGTNWPKYYYFKIVKPVLEYCHHNRIECLQYPSIHPSSRKYRNLICQTGAAQKPSTHVSQLHPIKFPAKALLKLC